MTIMDELKNNMQNAIDHLEEELKGLRTNRPNPALLENVVVDAYGAEMKLRDLASVSVVEGRQLLVSPFDSQMLGAIAKGVEKANLGLQITADATSARVSIPPMSEELRKGIARDAKDKSEKTKVVIRDHRRKANDKIKKQKTDGEISEDEKKKSEKSIQELTDQFCKKADQFYALKEKDILEI